MNSQKIPSRKLSDRYLSRALSLALSVALLSSTTLPCLAVLSAPPSTSKGKTEKEKDTNDSTAKKDTAEGAGNSEDEEAKLKGKIQTDSTKHLDSPDKPGEEEKKPEVETNTPDITTPAPEASDTTSETTIEPLEATPAGTLETTQEKPSEDSSAVIETDNTPKISEPEPEPEPEPEAETETESKEEEKPKRNKPKHISEADRLLLKNEFEAAEEAYRTLVDEDENGDAYAGLAVALAKQDNPKKVLEAEMLLRKGKENFPDNPNMMAAAGFVAFKHSNTVASPARRDRYMEASEILCEKAISANPDIVIAQQTLGIVKMAMDDPESAVPPFQKCYELTEDEVNATYLAQALLKVNPKDSRADKLIEEALGINPDFSPAKLQKALYLTSTGKHEEAYTELHSILRPERESEWYKVQGDIFQKQGDGNSAVNSWKESLRRNPRNPSPYKSLAEHYMMRGDGELAIAEMHSALEILPNDVKLRQKLAELALRLNKLEVAEQEFRTILNVKPDDPSSLLGLARVFFRKARVEGQYPPGWIPLRDKLQDVLLRSSTHVKGKLYELNDKVKLTEAEKALTQKQFRDAHRFFGEVITRHKDDAYQLLTLAEQAFHDGDLKSAELAYSYAREIPEVSPRAEQGLSKITSQRKEAKRQIKLGDATERKLPDVAEDHYKQALIADPQAINAYYNLFFLFLKERKDKIEKTIEYGENFLEVSDDADPRRKDVERTLFKLKERLRKENSK